MGLRYESEDIYNAYIGVISNNPELRANSIELLDNILDGQLKRIIIPIVDTFSPELIVEKSRQYFGFDMPSEDNCFELILNGKDSWLKVCALYLLSEIKNNDYKDIVFKLAGDSDKLVKETAQFCLEKYAA